MKQFLPVTESESMFEYARHAVERHMVLREMPEDVEEDGGTEALWRIEDRMSIGWQQLEEAQRQAVSGLTSDLAWVRRKGALPPKSHGLDDVSLIDAKRLIAAISNRQIYEALHYIRVCNPLTGKRLSAVWRASLYRDAFRGVASEVFNRAVADVYPQFVDSNIPPNPIDKIDMEDAFLPDEITLNVVEAFQHPHLASRLAALMFETMPWPIAMRYLQAAVSQIPEDAVAAR